MKTFIKIEVVILVLALLAGTAMVLVSEGVLNLFYEPVILEHKVEPIPTDAAPVPASEEIAETPETVNITPAIPGGANGAQTAGTAFNPAVVVGLIYDVDAMMVDFQLESALATYINPRKRYSNLWLSVAKNAITDFTENGVLLYMDD